jgi:hypothetical protein
MIKISKLDSIVSDVRERKIGTLEARVKILDWINKIEVDEAIDLVKNLSLCEVSHRRELLIDFSKWIFSERKDVTIKMIKEDVETFLGN